jgi:hypothetical protein
MTDEDQMKKLIDMFIRTARKLYSEHLERLRPFIDLILDRIPEIARDGVTRKDLEAFFYVAKPPTRH